MADLEPREKDMLLMGKLEVMMIPDTQSSEKERERQSYRFVLFILFMKYLLIVYAKGHDETSDISLTLLCNPL